MEYEEHEKRAWSVDFSQTDPSMLVSGSDDCKVCVDFFNLCPSYLCHEKHSHLQIIMCVLPYVA